LGPELLLTLDRQQAKPLRSQLEDGIREAIRSGRLQADERLPSSRVLASELGVSRGLVQECYNQLQAEGYLNTRAGSATRVAPGGGTGPAQGTAGGALRPERAAPAPDKKSATPPLTVDFVSGVPDLSSFPRTDWAWAHREACRNAPNAAFNYGDPRGSEDFREILAAYLRRVRAAAADPDHLVVCTGFAQGLILVLGALVRAGIRRVAFEDPGYGDGTTMAAGAWAGVEPVPVPVDESGLDVGQLAETGARAAVLTPAHQWPTGVVLAPERRRALISWAAECDGFVIEDDYDAEFRYDRDPVGALQGLAPDRVIALGTVSKSLAPAVRLGWFLCPPDLMDAVVDAKRLTDRGSPVLDQLAVATLMESGRYDRHLRRMRASYGKRRRTLVESLATHAPHVRLTGLAAGFHAVAHLPAAADERAVIAAARERGIGLYGMSEYRSDHALTPAQLVLGFGNLTERAIERGVATVGDLLQS
jgi:GntR family transcriptional regulator/MocR family aminotransferase